MSGVPARPFRFIAPMPRVGGSVRRWRDELRHIEDLGFSSVSVSEHLTGGWALEPLTALMAAADATTRLRLLSLVLINDLRHPVLLHKAAATIDVLSEGRLELGIGAGWLEADYAAAGLDFDPPGLRIARLIESVAVIKKLFRGGAATIHGGHYRTTQIDGVPRAVQKPHPPILVGGGGRRILEFAGREADIVAVHARLGRGRVTHDSAQDFAAERMAEKVRWIRGAATAAGAPVPELQFNVYLCRIGGSSREGAATISTFARGLAVDPRLVAESPSVLIGSVDTCADLLLERRDRYGFSYLRLSDDIEAVAPLIARLRGR